MNRAPESINGIRRIQFSDGSVIYVPDSTTKPPQADVVNAPIFEPSQAEISPSRAPVYDTPNVQTIPGVRVSGNTIVVSGGNGAPGGSNGQNGADAVRTTSIGLDHILLPSFSRSPFNRSTTARRESGSAREITSTLNASLESRNQLYSLFCASKSTCLHLIFEINYKLCAD